MSRSLQACPLVLGLILASGCGTKDAAVCSTGDELDARKNDAQAAAKTQYSAPVITPCPELDLPLDGQASSEGLTAGEYGSLLRGSNGNFFDDGRWWLKAMPRGAERVDPVQISAERCQPVTFAKFGYDYAFATPPLVAAPACGRYLTGLEVGHQIGDSWPEILDVDGSGLIRLAPLAVTTAFAALLRAPRAALDAAGPDSTLERIDVLRHDGDTVELLALANGPNFAAVLRLVLKVGDSSRLSVQMEFEPRALAGENPVIAVAGLSGKFANADERDFDQVQGKFADGSSFTTVLADPTLDWGADGWTRIPLAQGSAELESVTFSQASGAAERAPYPNLMLSNFQSSLPIAFELSVTKDAPPGGNVVAELLVDSSLASATGAPISVSYLVTASPR